MLKKPKADKIFANKYQSKYQSGIRKKMHVMRQSRPDIYNATHDYARHMIPAEKTHYDFMMHVMDYIKTTPEGGLVLKPFGLWDGIDADQ